MKEFDRNCNQNRKSAIKLLSKSQSAIELLLLSKSQECNRAAVDKSAIKLLSQFPVRNSGLKFRPNIRPPKIPVQNSGTKFRSMIVFALNECRAPTECLLSPPRARFPTQCSARGCQNQDTSKTPNSSGSSPSWSLPSSMFGVQCKAPP